jgi:hypothetical protein
MATMKALSKYVQLLEKQLEIAQKQLADARKDLEFYRGKCERLELAVMSVAAAPAAAEYVQQAKPAIKDVKLQQVPPRLPFTDIKRRWNAMTEEEQQKALKDGWDLDAKESKEETNAGQ